MTNTERQNIDYFNKAAKEYDERYQLSITDGQARAQYILDQSILPLKRGIALDLGCGTGNLSIGLIRENLASKCIGLDISHAMACGAKIKSAGVNGLDYIVASALQLPFKNDSFSLIVGDAFLHHILDVNQCLREVRRVLKVGGCATFNEPSLEGYSFLEMILKIIYSVSGEKDRSIIDYLYFLSFLRENAEDIKILDALELPDKHFFSKERMERLAQESGFSDFFSCPSVSYYPGLWQKTFQNIVSAIKPTDALISQILDAGYALDSIIGEPTTRHFCLHQQSYFYK